MSYQWEIPAKSNEQWKESPTHWKTLMHYRRTHLHRQNLQCTQICISQNFTALNYNPNLANSTIITKVVNIAVLQLLHYLSVLQQILQYWFHL